MKPHGKISVGPEAGVICTQSRMPATAWGLPAYSPIAATGWLQPSVACAGSNEPCGAHCARACGIHFWTAPEHCAMPSAYGRISSRLGAERKLLGAIGWINEACAGLPRGGGSLGGGNFPEGNEFGFHGNAFGDFHMQ